MENYTFDTLFDKYFESVISGAKAFRTSEEVKDRVATVKVEVPGLTSQDLDITLDQNVLTIRQTSDESTRKVRYSVPDIWDATSIKAKCENGLLIITLSRKSELKPKKIAIE